MNDMLKHQQDVENTMNALDAIIAQVPSVESYDEQFQSQVSLYYELAKYLRSRLYHVELLITQGQVRGERI